MIDPTVAWKDTERLVHHMVWQFCRKNGHRYRVDDYLGEAWLAFEAACRYFDESRNVPFPTFLATCIRNRLIDVAIKETNNRGRYSQLSALDRPKFRSFLPTVFDAESLLNKLSDDAQCVVELVLDTPRELLDMVERKGSQPRNWRSSIKEWLRTRYRWDDQRIRQTFEELRCLL